MSGKRSSSHFWVAAFFWLLGLVSLGIHFWLEAYAPSHHVWIGLFETFGVTLTTVLTVKVIYEKYMLEDHLTRFTDRLTPELMVICQSLGIREIFDTTGDEYDRKYGLHAFVEAATAGSRLRIIGNTVHFLLVENFSLVEKALQKGLRIDICVSDPATCSANRGFVDIDPKQVNFTRVRTLFDDLVQRQPSVGPSGSLEIKLHKVLLYDTFTSFGNQNDPVTILWQLSFGASSKAKRTFVADAARPLGGNLRERYYDKFWGQAKCIAKYEGGKVAVNQLGFYS